MARRKRRLKGWHVLFVLAVAGIVAGCFWLKRHALTPPPAPKSEVGYARGDREMLNELMDKGTE